MLPIELYRKAEKVLHSCKTREQIDVAANYIERMQNLHFPYLGTDTQRFWHEQLDLLEMDFYHDRIAAEENSFDKS